MSKDTKMKKRISKTRQAKMREKELKSTLKFGVKLVLILAVVIGCAQLFFMERMWWRAGAMVPLSG